MTKITMQNGTEITLRPVSEFLVTEVRNKARADFEKEHGKIPDAPTYEIKCGGGPFGEWVEIHEHKTDTIERGTDEAKEQWEIRVKAQDKLNALVWERTAMVYLLDGLPDPPDDGWMKRQARHGIVPPDDQDERKMHWVKTEVVVSNTELGWLVRCIQGQSSFTEAGRQIAADMFRRAMEFTGRTNA